MNTHKQTYTQTGAREGPLHREQCLKISGLYDENCAGGKNLKFMLRPHNCGQSIKVRTNNNYNFILNNSCSMHTCIKMYNKKNYFPLVLSPGILKKMIFFIIDCTTKHIK